MDDSKTSEAIILRRNDWRESDSRVVLYTKNFGKIVLVARGVKKFRSKLAGHIEPLNRVRAMILKGKAFDYLGAAIVSRAYINIKNDLNALYFAGAALSLIDKQVKEDVPDEELYGFITNWLNLLDDKSAESLDKDDGELLFDYFSLHFLTILGYKPELYSCLDCRKKLEPSVNYFNLRQGGVVCAHCFEENKNKYLPNEVLALSNDCIKIMRIFCQEDNYQHIKVETKIIRELSRLIKSFIIFN